MHYMPMARKKGVCLSSHESLLIKHVSLSRVLWKLHTCHYIVFMCMLVQKDILGIEFGKSEINRFTFPFCYVFP